MDVEEEGGRQQLLWHRWDELCQVFVNNAEREVVLANPQSMHATHELAESMEPAMSLLWEQSMFLFELDTHTTYEWPMRNNKYDTER